MKNLLYLQASIEFNNLPASALTVENCVCSKKHSSLILFPPPAKKAMVCMSSKPSIAAADYTHSLRQGMRDSHSPQHSVVFTRMHPADSFANMHLVSLFVNICARLETNHNIRVCTARMPIYPSASV